MERLGLGPDVCLERNPRLVFGRMTGWGQSGMYADAAGHDINYISLAGALAHFGRDGQPPVPPLNMVGDFGGGGMFLAFGVVCALLEAGPQRARPGRRCCDGRRNRRADEHVLDDEERWTVRRGPSRHQPARHRRTFLRRVPMCGRHVHLDRLDRAEVLRRTVAPRRSRQ